MLLSEIIPGINREVTAAELAGVCASTIVSLIRVVTEKLSVEEGYTLLHPFEDADVIAGQGTCGLEISQQCAEKRVEHLDALLIPTGGGGLCAGSSLAMAHEMPDTDLLIVEPEGYDDHVISLNKPGRNERVQHTIQRTIQHTIQQTIQRTIQHTIQYIAPYSISYSTPSSAQSSAPYSAPSSAPSPRALSAHCCPDSIAAPPRAHCCPPRLLSLGALV